MKRIALVIGTDHALAAAALAAELGESVQVRDVSDMAMRTPFPEDECVRSWLYSSIAQTAIADLAPYYVPAIEGVDGGRAARQGPAASMNVSAFKISRARR